MVEMLRRYILIYFGTVLLTLVSNILQSHGSLLRLLPPSLHTFGNASEARVRFWHGAGLAFFADS